MEDTMEMKAKAKDTVKQKYQQLILFHNGHNFPISNA